MNASERLNVLIVDDRGDDAELIVVGLEDAGYAIDWTRVDSQDDFEAELDPSLDVIVAGDSVPAFDVPCALDLIEERALDVPLIVVGGTITEETAVDCLKRGAADFIVKDRLARLPSAVADAVEARRAREERLHAEDALRSRDLSFVGVFENGAVGMALLESPSGRFRRVNAALCALSGYTERELLQLTAADLSFPEDVAEQRESFLDQLGSGAAVRSRRRCRRKDGECRWIAFSVTPFADDLGLVVVEDITEQHAAEAALRASEAQSRRLFEQSPVAMSVNDPQAGFVRVNAAMRQLFGYTEMQLLSLEARALVAPDEPEPPGETYGNDACRSAVRRCIRSDGREISVSATWNHFRDVDGRDLVFAIIEDITGQREAEAALRASEQLFRELFLNSPVPLSISEPGVRFHAVNPALCRMLGYTESELHALGPTRLTHPDDREQQPSAIAGANAAHTPLEFERRVFAKDGRTVHLRGNAFSFFRDEAGHELVVTSVEDVTERRNIDSARARLASIVELSGDAILANDLDGNITDWNTGAELLYGYRADEIVGENISVLAPAELHQQERERRAAVASTRRIDHYRTTRLHRTGKAITVDVTVSPIADASGTVVGTASISRSTEAQLRAEALFRRDPEPRGVKTAGLARAAAVLCVSLGVIALVGWALDIGAFKRIGPHLTSMKPQTAIAFVLLGVALLGSMTAGWLRRAGLFAAPATLFIGAAVLIEYATGRSIGVDRLLFAGALEPGPYPGRMAVGTAIEFSLLAIALLALWARRRRIAEVFGLLAFAGAGIALLGYVYGVRSLYSTGAYSTMAIHTAVGLMVASLGVVAATPGSTLARVRDGASPGAIVLRTMIPVAIIVMPVAGGLRLLGQAAGWYDTTFGVALLVVLSIAVILGMASRSARTIDRFYRERMQAGEELIGANDRLEARVADRTARLARSEERFRALVESAPDAMICIGPDGRIAIVNEQAERLFGYERAELLGKPVEILVPDAAQAAHPGHRAWYLASPHPRPMAAGIPLSARRQDGSEFPAEISLSTILTDTGPLIAAAVRDVTDQREAARRLEIMHDELDIRAQELDRSNHELEQFAYVASHDLKEPLRAVRGFSQLLARDYRGQLDARADEYIDFVTDGASRMQSLIDDLLAYARIGPEKAPREFPMRSAVDDAIANLHGAITDAASVEIDDLPDVIADQGQVTQLMQNLIGNALKFRGESAPVVRVDAEPSGTDWTISVTDNGIGIDPRFSEQIFTMFQRLHTRDDYAGTGVGLAICRKLVEGWGGRIWVESEPGNGAAFRFSIPGAQR